MGCPILIDMYRSNSVQLGPLGNREWDLCVPFSWV